MAMKKTTIRIILVFVGVLLLVLASVGSIPRLRAAAFVNMYHEQIEKSLAAGHGVPADDAVLFGYKAVNSWDQEHPMTEFILISYGDTYYGCYFSPDDVPLCFQNVDLQLTQQGNRTWKWMEEGDNYGETSRIRKCWYYFKASF